MKPTQPTQPTSEGTDMNNTANIEALTNLAETLGPALNDACSAGLDDLRIALGEALNACTDAIHELSARTPGALHDPSNTL